MRDFYYFFSPHHFYNPLVIPKFCPCLQLCLLTRVFFHRYLTGPLRGAHKPHPKVNGFFPGGRVTPEVPRVKTFLDSYGKDGKQ